MDFMDTTTKEIFFKASRKNSKTFKEYRQLIKRGDIEEDEANFNDDVIKIDTRDVDRIGIDCNKKTGEFRLFFHKNN